MTRWSPIGLAVGTSVVVAVTAPVWMLRRRLAVVEVQGMSMEPTLRSGDRVLVSRIPAARVRAGDIVVLERRGPVAQTPDSARPARTARVTQRDWIVKRAVAVAGDPVPPGIARAAGVAPGSAVPAGLLAVLGDNPAHSADSRVWGLLPAELVLGVVRRKLGEQNTSRSRTLSAAGRTDQ
jgi:signal peptidase I